MSNAINNIIEMLKKETNSDGDIVYRKKIINKETIYIIYNEPLTSSDKISDFIIRSLDSISYRYQNNKNLYEIIVNDINNFKVTEIKTYQEICYYLNYGFTIILFENNKYLALETKRNLARSISEPSTETTLRGAMDAFVEELKTNIGLVRKRIKNNN